MTVSVQIRLCIYAEDHEGPCIDPDGNWITELPIPPDVDGFGISHALARS